MKINPNALRFVKRTLSNQLCLITELRLNDIERKDRHWFLMDKRVRESGVNQEYGFLPMIDLFNQLNLFRSHTINACGCLLDHQHTSFN